MIQKIGILSVVLFMWTFTSCEKQENGMPPADVEKPIVVEDGREYFFSGKIGTQTLEFKVEENGVGNGVYKLNDGPCGFGDVYQFTSYFAYVADTSLKQQIYFGLVNCVPDSANGINDSTYIPGAFPIAIQLPDTASGFIHYIDPDSVSWNSSWGQNGLDAQTTHFMVIDSVKQNFDGVAALKIYGSFTGWVYNAQGDSQLVSSAQFVSKAWAH